MVQTIWQEVKRGQGEIVVGLTAIGY